MNELLFLCDVRHYSLTFLDVAPHTLMSHVTHIDESCHTYGGVRDVRHYSLTIHTFLDGYCSTVQDLLDWFEVDLGFTELLFIQIDLCVV